MGVVLHFCSSVRLVIKRGRISIPPGKRGAHRAKGTGLTEEDQTLLRDFGSGFGASDVEGQLSHCRLYAELFQDRLERARQEKARKGKLYLMLGSFSGIAVALFLC